MDWMQLVVMLVAFMGMLVAFIGLFLWVRAEARSDMRHFDAQVKENARHSEVLLGAIHKEMKDFHGVLCGMQPKSSEQKGKEWLWNKKKNQ